MKQSVSLLLMLVLSLGVSMAQAPKKNVVTQVFKTDIRCHNCEKKIMDNVSALGKGVRDVKVDVETKEVTVTFDASKTNAQAIVKGLEKLKVNATPMKPEKALASPMVQAAPGRECLLQPAAKRQNAVKPARKLELKK